ncbi:MAG: hypothetical protein FD143_1555 [Ignavibacteria bacterium]|nr:MAG: hypothetical protein FD143_1555 [Ignavibacteria bacterium]KAF0161847.1 MAG: hypothetical protein FD188_441 [Ignavibacteria bacterium]
MKNILFVVFCLVLLSEAAFSQSLSFGPHLGFVKTKDAEKSVMMPGGAVRLYLGGIGIEGAIYYKKDEYKIDLGNSTYTITTKTYPIMLSALLKILPIAHLEGGVSWLNTTIDYSNLSSTWTSIKEETKGEAAYHFGGGIEIPFGSLVLTGDIRYVFFELDMDKLTKPQSLKSDFYAIMVGLMFKL